MIILATESTATTNATATSNYDMLYESDLAAK